MKLRIIIFVLIGVLIWWIVKKKSPSNAPMHGTIIILNGPSASGKSSIAKEIQNTFNEFYIRVGIDNLFDAVLPEPNLADFTSGVLMQKAPDGRLIRAITLQKDAEGNQIIPLEIGPIGLQVIRGMHRAVAAYAKTGNNIVVDYSLYEKQWLPDLYNALKKFKVYMIGIRIPLAVLEEREKKRGTSLVVHGRSHYAIVHTDMTYDLELDTSVLSAKECAIQIKEFIKQNPSPQAFKTLAKAK
jgi:chloramphenicol 3-O phosphotransferase